ncbi:hypothetical protein A5753_17525 [Mycobacterium sp. 852002-51971_SCH5477799-a]|uniref:hypothetical protein n=1 Tax=Mycobacterium sp. 852002-51971_SCH5477799-a TaxID=1834106 RepID=UPI0007FE5F29|nr:hypothetical protein [Mycobacterium sp. 852002-51971_SCH5477799-a]OBF61775.1 hypothetical protein A5753_17525 [Mycobacterium sp. 852002-51971_SCH5477799-a]
MPSPRRLATIAASVVVAAAVVGSPGSAAATPQDDAYLAQLRAVGSLVNAAHSIYCPSNVCDAPSICT